MDLRLMRTFQVAARHLNFHRAAEALYLSQPTVSKHIQQLEQLLHCKLFERSGRTLRLTPAGERLTVYAGRLVEQFDASLEEFAAWLAGKEERLLVAASPMVARSVLPWILRTYRSRMPNVEPIISVFLSEEIPPVIVDGDAEIGLSRIKPEDPRLTGELLYRDAVVFVAPPVADGAGSAADEGWMTTIQRYPLITHNHPGYWDDLLLAIRQLVPRIHTMVVTQVDITKRLVEEGLGVSFLPRSAVHREVRDGQLVELPVPELTMPLAASWLVMRADRPLSAGARAFVELVRDLQAELVSKDISEILG